MVSEDHRKKSEDIALRKAKTKFNGKSSAILKGKRKKILLRIILQ